MCINMKWHYCDSRVYNNYFSGCVLDIESVRTRVPQKHTLNSHVALDGEAESKSKGIERYTVT